MSTKLTLQLDEELVERAKTYSKQTGKSVSQLVADYFEMLPEGVTGKPSRSTPIVRSLRGLLRGTGVNEEDYRRYLEGKNL